MLIFKYWTFWRQPERDTTEFQPIYQTYHFPGTLDPEQLKNHLTEHVINKRDKNGGLMFPRLRHQLVSRWGNYAWDASVTFIPENHFIVASAVYRGRQVGENNIQVRLFQPLMIIDIPPNIMALLINSLRKSISKILSMRS